MAILATPATHQTPLSTSIRAAIEAFSKRADSASAGAVTPADTTLQARTTVIGDITYYGIPADTLKTYPLPPASKAMITDLRSTLIASINPPVKSITQVVGDSTIFTPAGTEFAQKHLAHLLNTRKDVIEYGFTGHVTETDEGVRRDTNAIVTKYAEEFPLQQYRIVGNVVGHSITAFEKWGCNGLEDVKKLVLVYNEDGTPTLFGDDTPASDEILSPGDNTPTSSPSDRIVMYGGGMQAWEQANNAMMNDVPIEAVDGLRTERGRTFFSATEFLRLVKNKLEEKPDLNKTEVRAILDEYLTTHEAWDPKKEDAETKAALFYSAVDKFIEREIYLKLPKLFNVTDMPTETPQGKL